MKTVFSAAFIFFFFQILVFAQWTSDPSLNTPVCIWESAQYTPEIVSDGKGGVIIAWTDVRLGNPDIFIQRINGQGYKLWEDSGKAVCINNAIQFKQKIIEDGEGGSILVWTDNRNGNLDIYAQRVDSSGNIVWDPSGISVCTVVLDQEDPKIISDGSGGAIIMWEFKQGAAGETGLYAQRINSAGQILWNINGVPIATSPSADPVQLKPKMTIDDMGGIVIAWVDYSTSVYPNIFAQRLDGSGNVLWSQNGIQVRTSNSDKRFQNIIKVGNGEFILSWNESISSNDWDLRAQKIDTSGNIKWNSEGIIACSSDVSFNPSAITFDNNNALIIGWEDTRVPGVGSTIYCQKLDLNGDILWQQNGIPVSSLNGMQGFIELICDTDGNAIACWLDARVNPSWDIYAQKFDGAGNRSWELEGKPMSIANGSKSSKKMIVTSNEDFIVTWQDERNLDPDIYAQSLDALITSVDPPLNYYPEYFSLFQNYPNPFNPNTKIRYTIPSVIANEVKQSHFVSLKVYDVLGNEIITLVDEYKPAGSYEIEFNTSSIKHQTSSGVYFYQLKAGSFVEVKKMILLK